MKNCNDFPAAEAVYHATCCCRFCTNAQELEVYPENDSNLDDYDADEETTETVRNLILSDNIHWQGEEKEEVIDESSLTDKVEEEVIAGGSDTAIVYFDDIIEWRGVEDEV